MILSPEDRERLLRLLRAGALLTHEFHDVVGIVGVKTYQQWLEGLLKHMNVKA